MAEIEQIVAKITADPSGFTAGMQTIQQEANKATQNVSEQFKQMGDKLKGIGGFLSVTLTLPLEEFGRKSLQAFNSQEKALTLVGSAIKATGGAVGFTTEQLSKMSEELEKVSTFADEEILQGVTLSLLKFGSIHGETFKRAQQVILDFATQSGMGLEGASRAVGRALENPTVGLSMLRRQGVMFTDEQENMIKKMVQVGDRASAQAIILSGLEGKFKGAAQAMRDTDAGKIAGDMNRLNNAMEEVGKILSAVLVPIVDKIGDMADAFRELSPQAQKFIVITGLIVAAIGPLLAGLGFFMTMVVPALIAGFGALVTVISGALIPALLFFIEVVLPIIVVLGLLAVATQVIVDNWSALKSVASSVWNFVAGAVQLGVSNIIRSYSFIPGIGEKFKKVADDIKKSSDESFSQMSKDFDEAGEKSVSFGDSMNNLKNTVVDAAEQMKDSLSGMFSGGGKKKAGPGAQGGPAGPPSPEPKELPEWVKNLQQLPMLAETSFNATMGAATQFATGMANILLTGTGDWKQLLLGALQSMLGAIVQWAILSMLSVKSVAEAFTALFANPIAAIFVIAGLIGAVAALSSSMPKMAKGGIVDKPTIAMIGESGPEAVLPLSRTANGQMGVQIQAPSEGAQSSTSSSANGNQNNNGDIHLQVNLNDQPILSAVSKASRNGRIIIHPNAVRTSAVNT